MRPNFYWDPQSPEVENSTKEKIEADIQDIIQRFISQEAEFQTCHDEEPFSIHLGITGPLNERLQGKISCCCGRVLASFKGDDKANDLKYQVYSKDS